MLSVGEEEGMVEVCATLITSMEEAEGNFSVMLTTIDGTGMAGPHHTSAIHHFLHSVAMAGSDYDSTSFMAVFLRGTRDGAEMCVNITIRDDSALEGDQSFTVMLSTAQMERMLGNTQTAIVIRDVIDS